jgi:molybdopterin molybdotransferase
LSNLLAVDEAIRRILDRIPALSVESVPTPQALGRVLAQDIIAAADIPPFANSGMDGYAVRAADTRSAAPDSPVQLTVVADIPAGVVPDRAVGSHEAARIMTGAPLPDGADAVIPVEHTDDDWRAGGDGPLPDTVRMYQAARPGANVRPAGEDMHTGQTILHAGAVLRPQDTGVLIALSHAEVPVFRQPKVAILSTGDELVDLDEPLAPGQIRNSNSYVLAGMVAALGGLPIRLPVARDTLDDVRQRFGEALAHQPDVIISSAGVSVGTRDVVRAVVEELGALDLWRVNLRPGKPLAFGQVRGVPFFGLPGNPVSTMVTFDVFVRPALYQMTGRDPSAVLLVMAVTGEDIESDGRRSYLRVTLKQAEGEWIALLTGTQSSGALLSMVLADGLLIVPEGMKTVPAGSSLPVRVLRDLPMR